MPNVFDTHRSSSSTSTANRSVPDSDLTEKSSVSQNSPTQQPSLSSSDSIQSNSEPVDSVSAMVETSTSTCGSAEPDNDNIPNGNTLEANGNNSSESSSEEKGTDIKGNEVNGDIIEYEVYESEEQMPDIMRLITKDLSEPYSIYTYRYFIHNWPKLCFLAKSKDQCIGAIVCKLDLHKKMVRRGYIAMLAVDQNYRRKGIGSQLVLMAIKAMIADECDEVVLETEISNKSALHLYENLGFVRDKRLFRYYLNGVDALRLKLWLR